VARPPLPLRKGATRKLVATKAGACVAFSGGFPRRPAARLATTTYGSFAGTEPGSVGCESLKRRLSSAPAGVMAGFGRW